MPLGRLLESAEGQRDTASYELVFTTNEISRDFDRSVEDSELFNAYCTIFPKRSPVSCGEERCSWQTKATEPTGKAANSAK